MEYQVNPFTKFKDEWAVVSAGTKEKFNSMTIGWGAMGTIWRKNVITIYVRPERYTLSFIQNNEYFTLSWFDKKYQDSLMILGKKSGRDCNKIKEANLTPKFLDNGGITFEEAKETIVLKKIFMQQMDKNLIPEDAMHYYGEEGFAHYIIMGEIVE